MQNKTPAMRRHWATMALVCALAVSACSNDSATSLVASGKEALAKKEPRKAVIQFKSALQKEPQSAEVRYLLGQALLDSGDPFGAVVELTKALDQRYDDNKVMPPLAKAMLLAGGAKKLTTLYGEVNLSDKTAQASLKSSVANAWGVLGDKAKAQSALALAIAAAPDFPAAMVLQARFMAVQGRFDDALATIAQVLSKDQGNAEAWHLQGEILVNAKKDIAKGEEAFNKALASEPAFMESHLALIGLKLRANDLPAAKAQAERLHKALPTHPQTMFVDAQMALVEKDLPKARDLSQRLLRGAPDNTGVLQLSGIVEARAGALAVAETHFAKALKIDPELPLARRNLARLYLRTGQAARALNTIEPMTAKDSADPESLSIAGEAELQLGDARTAELLFLRAAKLTPDDQQLRTALALMQLSKGDANGAFAELESIASKSTTSFADMALISARINRKEFDAALTAIEALAKKEPKNAAMFELRGRVHALRKDFAAARAAFEQALAIEPSRFSSTSGLAVLDLAERKVDQATQRLQDAVKADPRNHFARMALADLRLNEGAQLAEVREILAEGIKASPSEPGPRLRLIELLSKRRQYKEALAVAQEANAALPNDTEVLDALGRAQTQAGDVQQAISTFRKLASVDTKSARPHTRLADVLKRSGDREGAIASLRRALEVEPNLEAAQTALVENMVASGRPKDALHVARDMQKNTPQSPAGYMLEGAVHRRLKATDAAIAAYSAGLRQAKSKTELATELHRTYAAAGRNAEADRFGAAWLKDNPNDAAFEYQLATVLVARGDHEAAEGHLTRVVAARPNDPLALNNLAWVLAARNKPGALAYAQKATDLLPNRPPLMDTLALALAADKQFPKALEMQKKAIEIAPGDMGLRLNLAKIAIQAGDKTLARTELERLAAQGGKLGYQAEVQRLLKTL